VVPSVPGAEREARHARTSDLDRVGDQRISVTRRVLTKSRNPGRDPQARVGTCRDFALLMMEVVRRLAWRRVFVSGYLYDASVTWEMGRR